MLLTNDFYQYSFCPSAVELAIEDLLPRSEIELAFGDGQDDLVMDEQALQVAVAVRLAGAVMAVIVAVGRHHHFPTHDLPLMVGIAVILTCAIMMIGLWRRIIGSQFFQPSLVVFVQALLIIVDEHRCGYVHCVNQYKAILNAALFDGHLRRANLLP